MARGIRLSLNSEAGEEAKDPSREGGRLAHTRDTYTYEAAYRINFMVAVTWLFGEQT